MNPATEISLSTVRLECTGRGAVSVGTGYLYCYKLKGGEIYPVIVTNKHVIAHATKIKTEFHVIKQGADVGEDGHADFEEKLNVEFDDFESDTIFHPDKEIDLCAILLGKTLNRIRPGYGVKNVFLNKGWHIEPALESIIRPIESVIMIGYPNGLWDEVNNRPIARRGLTASHPLKPWNGKRQFMIDAACFPGSSGSPVFLYEDGLYRNNEGVFVAGTRAKLLGTLFSGPLITANGKLVEIPIPTTPLSKTETEKIPVIQTMMNLGNVLHASLLDDLRPLVENFMQKWSK
ncbi:serine protease [Paraburkholderia fungorum]|uniref:S1 family peptidase n=1 Tax=Paraburkholderia fungorum TaxID=134537 RepID=UPI003877C786